MLYPPGNGFWAGGARMFTGIVDDIGRVAAVERPGDTRFCIETAYDTATIALGASIACSGACLTVVATGPGWFAVEASAETLSRTTLGGWRIGTPVNLELAYPLVWIKGIVEGSGDTMLIWGPSTRAFFKARNCQGHGASGDG